MKLSILTATYNRANMLSSLYKSIKTNLDNSNLECEWIIVDDGSIDNTREIVDGFKSEEKVKIEYYFQENSGKMAAINKAVDIASGDLIVDCDSDDYFTDNAFDIIEKNAEKLLENKSLYGLIFLKAELDGSISGEKFKKENKETTVFELYFKDNIQGEKIIVFNSKIRKKYLHEIENNEKFITEGRMYHKMDKKYKVLCINEIIQQGDYIEGGYTKNIVDMLKKYPYGYYKYFEEILGNDMRGVLFEKRVYAIKHYILFGVLTNKKMNVKSIKNVINKILYIILYLPGVIKSKSFLNK